MKAKDDKLAAKEAETRELTLMDLLDARENRANHQKELLARYDCVLVSMTLNIPGPVKDSPACRRALKEGMARLKSALARSTPQPLIHQEGQADGAEDEKGIALEIIYEEIRLLSTGPEGYLCVKAPHLEEASEEAEALLIKKTAVDVEEQDALGRLLDIDVLTRNGGVSRSRLGLEPRKCLLCQEDAKVCARSRRHDMKDLLKKVDEILAMK